MELLRLHWAPRTGQEHFWEAWCDNLSCGRNKGEDNGFNTNNRAVIVLESVQREFDVELLLLQPLSPAMTLSLGATKSVASRVRPPFQTE